MPQSLVCQVNYAIIEMKDLLMTRVESSLSSSTSADVARPDTSGPYSTEGTLQKVMVSFSKTTNKRYMQSKTNGRNGSRDEVQRFLVRHNYKPKKKDTSARWCQTPVLARLVPLNGAIRIFPNAIRHQHNA